MTATLNTGGVTPSDYPSHPSAPEPKKPRLIWAWIIPFGIGSFTQARKERNHAAWAATSAEWAKAHGVRTKPATFRYWFPTTLVVGVIVIALAIGLFIGSAASKLPESYGAPTASQSVASNQPGVPAVVVNTAPSGSIDNPPADIQERLAEWKKLPLAGTFKKPNVFSADAFDVESFFNFYWATACTTHDARYLWGIVLDPGASTWYGAHKSVVHSTCGSLEGMSIRSDGETVRGYLVKVNSTDGSSIQIPLGWAFDPTVKEWLLVNSGN